MSQRNGILAARELLVQEVDAVDQHGDDFFVRGAVVDEFKLG